MLLDHFYRFLKQHRGLKHKDTNGLDRLNKLALGILFFSKL